MIKHHNGMFLTNDNPSPVVLAAMESIKAQMAAEAEYRKAVREGRIPAGQWGNWSISDRH